MRTKLELGSLPSVRLIYLVTFVAAFGLLLAACGEEEDFDDPGADERPTIDMASQGSEDGDSDRDNERDDSTGVPPLYEALTHEEEHLDQRVTLITYGQKPVAHMDALLQGELALNGECLGVAVPDSEEFVHVVWPYGYAAGFDDDRAILLDENGEVVAHEGDLISMGGGNGADPDGDIASVAPTDCIAESFWYAGDPPQRISDLNAGTGEIVTPDPDSTPHVQTEEEAREQDAQSYADAFDVSLEEALWRMEMQQRVGPLNPELEQNEAHSFGGLYLQHEPEFKVVVLMTDGDEEAVRQYIDDPELEEILEVRTVEATYAELLTAQQEAMDLLHELGLMVSGGTNVQENRVEIYAGDPDLVLETLEAAGGELPEHVVVVDEDEDAETLKP